MLFVVEKIRALQVRITLLIAGADGADFDRGFHLAAGRISSVLDERPGQAFEVALNVSDHHVLHLELRMGVCGINLPGDRGGWSQSACRHVG